MNIEQINVDGLRAELADGARLIDVREPDEFVEVRVPGARHIPLATVPEHLDAFRGDGPTYVICKSGGRSQRACEFVAAQGFDDAEVVNVAGGTMAWVDAGFDAESGPADES